MRLELIHYRLIWSHWCLLKRLDDDIEQEYYITEANIDNDN